MTKEPANVTVRYRLPSSTIPDICPPSFNHNSTRMDRLGRLHALSFRLYLYESETSLSELWSGFRSGLLEPADAVAKVWDRRRGQSMRRMLDEEWKGNEFERV